MLKVLITGGSGLLATNWACFARDKIRVVLALHKTNVLFEDTESVFLNLESRDDILDKLVQISPDVVIHAAGLTNVDECQLNPLLAKHINCELAENVAFVCAKTGIKLVHISTDHLFSSKNSFSTENSNPQPVNVYAESKLNAEFAVKKLNNDALIIRTNFFGWGHQFRQSFSDWIYINLINNKEISLFDDVYFTPILIDSLATHIHALLALNEYGIFNVVSDDRISKYEFGLHICEKFNLSSNLIKPASIASLKSLAPRPHDMSLSNHKLKLKLGINYISVSNEVEQLKLQLGMGRPLEIQKAIRGV
ncbi:MAG: SDR family oxidoreductase [Methylotenera sp.]|nr:SDR family oxidoreductase [Methylotenera sp.]